MTESVSKYNVVAKYDVVTKQVKIYKDWDIDLKIDDTIFWDLEIIKSINIT